MDAAEVGRRFVREVIGDYHKYLKSIWHLPKKGNEINLSVLLDDTEPGFSRDVLGDLKMRAAEFTKGLMKKGVDFIVHFHLLTDYWEQLRHGNPVLMVEIKESVPIFDESGFFTPIKALIEMGRVPGTKEALKMILSSSPLRLHRIKTRMYVEIASLLMEMVVDAAQALLMERGVSPPVPKKVPEKLRKFVPELDEKFVKDAEKVIKFWKAIEHGEKRASSIKGHEMDEMIRRAFEFTEEVWRMLEHE